MQTARECVAGLVRKAFGGNPETERVMELLMR